MVVYFYTRPSSDRMISTLTPSAYCSTLNDSFTLMGLKFRRRLPSSLRVTVMYWPLKTCGLRLPLVEGKVSTNVK